MEKYLLPFNHAKDMKKHAANYENMDFRVGFVIKLKIH
jgi:hypothetical protein